MGQGPNGSPCVLMSIQPPSPIRSYSIVTARFLTGEAVRWCARYGIGLILPDGPGRMLTVLQSALEAVDAASIPDIDPAVIRAQCAADAVGIAREIVRAKIEAEAAHVGALRSFQC